MHINQAHCGSWVGSRDRHCGRTG